MEESWSKLRSRRDGAGGIRLAAVLEQHLERLVQLLDRLLGLAQQEVETAEVVEHPADRRAVRDLLELCLRLLRVLPSQDPLALALGDKRRLEVDTGDGPGVVQTLGELERALEILASRLVVPLAPIAPRSQAQGLRAEAIARQLGALGEGQRLVEEADRGLDAGQLETAGAEAEKDVRPVNVREHRVLGDCPRASQELDGRLDLTHSHECPGLAGQRANLELGRRDPEDGRPNLLELLQGLHVVMVLAQRLRARQGGLDPPAIVSGDPAREEARIDAELLCEPLDRLLGRARLATLDLADVLLR